MHTNMADHTAMGTKERDKIIIDFISKHQGCKSEDAFNGVKESMSRQTFFRHLNALRNSNVVIEERPNKRDRSLYINNRDLLVIVSNELDHFEGAYFELLRKVVLEIKNIPSAPDESRKLNNDQYEMIARREDLLFNALVFFKDMVDTYTFKLSMMWPVSISDRRHLERLQSMTLDRISKMYTKLYTMLKKNDVDYYINHSNFARGHMSAALPNIMKSEYGEDAVTMFIEEFEKYGLGKEVKKMLSCNAFSYS
jgi:hypothetical protein